MGDTMSARIARGRLRAFARATWQAHVVLDGSQAQVIMPVGEWVPPALLAAGDDVAVLLFEETNPDDGVVLGSYGAAPGDLFVGARVFHNASQSLSSGVSTALAFNSERFDSHAFHSTTSNHSRLTVPANLGGKYLITGSLQWDSSAAGNYRTAIILLNGATPIAADSRAPVSGLETFQHLTTLYSLDAGDYVQLMALQDSGGALDVEGANNYSPEFALVRLSP
jgi:hypothetical protein